MGRTLGRRFTVKLWLCGHKLKSGSHRSVVVLVSLILIIFELSRLSWRHGFNRNESTSARLDRLQKMRRDVCSRRASNEERFKLSTGNNTRRCKHQMCFAIVLTVNLGYYDFFLNWYKHYEKSVLRSSHQIQIDGDNNSDPIDSRVGAENIPFLLVIAEDDEVFEHLSSLPYLKNEKVDIIRSASASHRNADNKAYDYDSVRYKSLVSSRASHLLNLMCSIPDEEQSKNGSTSSFKRWILIYCEINSFPFALFVQMMITVQNPLNTVLNSADVDTVWLKNPIPIIQTKLFQGISKNVTMRELDFDVIAAVDDRNFSNIETYYCTGFLIIAPTDVSFIFLSHWENALISNPQLNQPIFNSMLVNRLLPDEDIHMRHGELSEQEFPSGIVYFDILGKDQNNTELQARAAVVHNNFIIGGDNKKKRFEDNGLWLV